MAEDKPDAPQDDQRGDEQPAQKAGTPVPPRTPLRQRLREKFNRASKSEVAEVLKDTAEDLKTNNKERAGLAVSTIIPGGWIAYYAHRRHKYKKKMAGNDDAGENPQFKKPAPPKP